MLDPRRHAAALLAVLALAAPAAAREPVLLAQMEEPAPSPDEFDRPPLLTGDPPVPLGEGGDGEETDGTDTGTNGGDTSGGETTGGETTGDGETLADTGLDAGLVALLGLGLIASGGGLRASLGRGD